MVYRFSLFCWSNSLVGEIRALKEEYMAEVLNLVRALAGRIYTHSKRASLAQERVGQILWLGNIDIYLVKFFGWMI